MLDLKTPHEIKPYTPAIVTVRIQSALHQRAKDAAWKNRVSLNQFIAAAIEEALRQCEEAEIAARAASGIPDEWMTDACFVQFTNDTETTLESAHAQANQ